MVSIIRSIAEKGPSTEEKVAFIEASLATYEAKIQGLGDYFCKFKQFYAFSCSFYNIFRHVCIHLNIKLI